MDDESLQLIEQQLTEALPDAPVELRVVVLSTVRGELRAARWDRRLGRVAAALLVAGVGLNVAIGLNAANSLRPARAAGPSQEALVQTALAVAEATDVETGRRVARQMAAWGGRSLTNEQLAALDAAIAAELPNGKDG
jgi:hypothetical protein